jgi:hypothetical protein
VAADVGFYPSQDDHDAILTLSIYIRDNCVISC